MTSIVTEAKIIKTICGGHRRYGYTMNTNYEWVCIECGLGRELHETNQETIARNTKVGA
jgi:hypothetical protein